MVRLLSLISGFALLTSAAAHAADVSGFTLDNGMDVVVLEDNRAPAVTHMVWYRAGAADEPPGKSGIAHYLEHLLFKGTDTVESGEFSRVVAENGGRDNAFTAQDYTGYFQRVATDRLELMMQYEADRMVNLKVDPAEAATELAVVIEERNQRTDNEPGALFGEQRMAAQYLNHPYAIPIVGWRHEIESLTLDDAMEFYRQHYGPNNAILIVAGDVDPDEVRRLAEQYYGVIPPNPNVKPRNRVSEPPQLAERRIKFEDPRVAQPYVIRSYLAPERDPGAQSDAAALFMLSEILGGSRTTSVLGEMLELDSQKAIYTSAFYSGMSLDDTTFGLIIVPPPDRSLEQAEADLDAAIATFIDEGVDEAQLERIKMQARASRIYAEDSVQSLARRYGAGLTSGLTVADIESWPDEIEAVTAEDVIAAAKTIFDRNKAVTGWYMRPNTGEVTQ